MSLEAIAISCFIVLSTIILGYLYTAVEFKHMGDNPDDFGLKEDVEDFQVTE